MKRYELVVMVRHINGHIFFNDPEFSDDIDDIKQLGQCYYNRYNGHRCYRYVSISIWDKEFDEDIPIIFYDNK